MRLFKRDVEPELGKGRQLDRSIGSMYSDDPVDPDHDVLNRRRLARQLARAIADLSQQTESAVVALVGPWGSGKTSLVEQIQEQLSSDGWHVGAHNPWSYSDYGGAVAGFFASLRDAVPESVLGKEWRESVANWVSRVAPFGAVGGVVGVDASGPVGAVGALLAGDRSPGRLRERAAEGLRSLEQPVLMVLDDLDRLSPEELLFTFKLVRLLGRLPNVYYLLAYDEQTLTEVLESTDLVGKGTGRAQQYLEKIIQVRLEIPPLLLEQEAALANACIDEICARHKITLSADAGRRLQKAWQGCLAAYLDQPRSVKRLFTQVDAMWPEVSGEVDFVDFTLVTFLRTFERRVLDLVVANRDEVLQHESSWSFGHQKETPHDRWKRWTQLIASAEPRYPTHVAHLLAEMFVFLRGARDNTTYAGSYQEDITRRLGVGSSEHFDRYIQVGVPESDLPQSVIRDAVSELRAESIGPAVKKLVEWMATDSGTAIRKLIREHDVDPLPATTLLPLLGSLYLSAMDQKGGMFSLSPDFGILLLAISALDATEPTHATTLLAALADANDSSLALAADAVRKVAQDTDKEHRWSELATPRIVQALEKALRRMATESVATNPRVTTFLYAYRALADAERARALTWKLVNQGAWQLTELLGQLVPLGQASNGEEAWTSMGDFSAGTVDDLLGIDAVLEQLPANPELLTKARAQSYFDRRVEPDDLAARTEYALTSLERLREERVSMPPTPTSAEDGAAGLDVTLQTKSPGATTKPDSEL